MMMIIRPSHVSPANPTARGVRVLVRTMFLIIGTASHVSLLMQCIHLSSLRAALARLVTGVC